MSAGKIAAQVAHASMLVFFGENSRCLGSITECKDNSAWSFTFGKNGAVYQWLKGSFAKIVLAIPSEKELYSLCIKAYDNNLPMSLVKDEGRTTFKKPTITCAAFGPWWSDALDKLTGHLKLLYMLNKFKRG